MAATDTGAKLRTAVLATIDKLCFGEDFGFDVAPTVAQSPTGQVAVVYMLIVTKKSPLLGQGPLAHVVHLPSLDPTPEQVEYAVAEAMKGLRELTSKLLTDGHAAAVHTG